ncbi:hypothetical protein D045_1418, partial [Vibrio parahaemolyticus VP-NY4]
MAQNATRKAITIKASKANTASVFVDAFELEAGERITIESTAAMTLTGTAGDTVTLWRFKRMGQVRDNLPKRQPTQAKSKLGRLHRRRKGAS